MFLSYVILEHLAHSRRKVRQAVSDQVTSGRTFVRAAFTGNIL